MKKIVVPLADGFEEIETFTIVDVLRRAGLEVVVAGTKGGDLGGAHGVRIIPDTGIDQVRAKDFDAVIVPGGQPGVDNLKASHPVLSLIRAIHSQKKLVAAICAAPLVLEEAGLTKGIHLTSYPGVEKMLSGCIYETKRVVVDGNIVTSRGPGTAMEFSLKLVELLVGSAKVAELEKAMVVR